MGKPSKAVLEFMETHKIDSDEIWEVHGSQWVVKHKALERVAVEKGIVWDRPQVITCDPANKIAVICAFGKLGDRSEWSFGEASPHNNKNAYSMAMAEKRAKDRVILKLLTSHGALYSESEADEFTQRPNPHVVRPEDVFDPIEHDQNGQPVDNIPMVDGKALPKKDSRETYKNLQAELWAHKEAQGLQAWGQTIAPRIASLPSDWAAIFRGQYAEHLAHLRNGKAA